MMAAKRYGITLAPHDEIRHSFMTGALYDGCKSLRWELGSASRKKAQSSNWSDICCMKILKV